MSHSLLHSIYYDNDYVKFINSEKAKKFCEISTLLLSNVVSVKRKVKISQNFVAFSGYMKFKNERTHVCTQKRKISQECWKLFFEKSYLLINQSNSNLISFCILHFGVSLFLLKSLMQEKGCQNSHNLANKNSTHATSVQVASWYSLETFLANFSTTFLKYFG